MCVHARACVCLRTYNGWHIILSCQVNELDVAMHSHQADTTSRRLQLERALTQRQADLRTRTQEVHTTI